VIPLGDHCAVWTSAATPHSGLQKPRKPLRFIDARNGRFARKGKAINIKASPTNLGVRSSNLFGRAKQYIDIAIDYQFR
jgi:hypothetical protein